MAQPRLASKTPAACAACYQQKHGVPHIDFRAALEGRLVDPSKPRGNHVDWVMICEDCLRNGISLLPEERAPREALEQRIASLEDQLRAAQEYADRIEDAFSHRPAREQRPTPAKPKPQRKPRYEPKAEA